MKKQRRGDIHKSLADASEELMEAQVALGMLEGLYAEPGDVHNHKCKAPLIPSPRMPESLSYLRWKCKECGSKWESQGPYHNGNELIYWRRVSNSSEEWRIDVLKGLQESIGLVPIIPSIKVPKD